MFKTCAQYKSDVVDEIVEMLGLSENISLAGIVRAVEKRNVGYLRYEKIRKLNPQQYIALVDTCLLSGEHFDEAVDKLEV